MKKNSTSIPRRAVCLLCQSIWYRRILSLSVIFILLISSALSQPVLLTQTSDHGGGTSSSLKSAEAFKDGKVLIATLFNKSSDINVTAPAGWNFIRKTQGDGMTLHTYYAVFSSKTSFEFNWNKAGPWSLAVVQFDGLTSCSLVDVTTDKTASDSKSISSANTSSSEDNTIILSVFAKNESKEFTLSSSPVTTINEAFQSIIPGFFSYQIGYFNQLKAGKVPTIKASTLQGQGSSWVNQIIALKPVSTLTGSPLIFQLSVSNDGKICENAVKGLDISLSGTQSNVNYQLKKNGIPVGAAIIGNGYPYTFADIKEDGNYSVTAFNTLSSCSTEMKDSVIVTKVAKPVASITTDGSQVLNCNISKIKLTATGGVSYIWNTGTSASTIDVITSGIYSVTAKNDAGCFSSAASLEIKEDKNITAVIEPPTTSVINYYTTAIPLQASGGVQYIWSTGASTSSITATAAGNYTVTVTGSNGCSATAGPIEITEDKKVEIDIKSDGSGSNGTELTCLKPSIVLTATGGVQYIWNTGSTTSSITVSSAGTYSVTATAANGGVGNKSIVITENKTVNAKIETPATTVLTKETTSIVLTASGAASYIWNTGETTSSITVTAAGSYVMTAIGENGCTAAPQSITITSDYGDDVDIKIVGGDGKPVLNCVQTSVQLTVAGGVKYLWSTSASTSSITVSTEGTYSVTVTTSNNVVVERSIVVSKDIYVPATIEVPPTTVLTCVTPLIVLNATGGASYFWSTGTSGSSLSVVTAGGYTVTVTGSNGCKESRSINITEDKTVTVNIAGVAAICTGTTTVLVASGGIAYSWNHGLSYSESIIISTPGDYTVEVTGSNGCVESKTTTVTEGAKPTSFTLTSDQIQDGIVSYCPGSGGAELKLTGSQNKVDYSLYRGGTTLVKTVSGTGSGISFGNQTAGIYTVIASAQGCTATMKGSVETREVSFPDYGSMVPSAINLLRWQTANIMAAPEGGNWTSRNPEIVTVDNDGLVTAVNVGSSFIDLQVNKQGCTYNLAVAVNIDANLPVEFIDISARNKDNDVLVEWILGSEADIVRYEVERSYNGVDFVKIGEVQSKGNSSFTVNYQYLDRNPMEGMNYYRIRSVGKDANDVEYSKVVWINMMSAKKNIALYPNPVIDNVIRMVWTNLPKGEYEVILMDMKGAKLLTRKIQYNGRYAFVELDVSFRFQKGYYNIQILRKGEGEVPEILQVFKF